MKYKVIHERDGCIGCGACAQLCPEYWKMSSDGKSTLRGSEESAGKYELILNKDFDCNKKAENACPVNIIHLKELKKPADKSLKPGKKVKAFVKKSMKAASTKKKVD